MCTYTETHNCTPIIVGVWNHVSWGKEQDILKFKTIRGRFLGIMFLGNQVSWERHKYV